MDEERKRKEEITNVIPEVYPFPYPCSVS